MASFNDVAVGASTYASDLNQLVDALNGVVAAQATLLGPDTTTFALRLLATGAPTADYLLLQAAVSNDAAARAGAYIRGASDHNGGIFAGSGAAILAHLYAVANGWKTDESLTVQGALNANGGLSTTSLNVSGSSPFALVTPSGVTITIGPNQPANPKKWDIWLKTPFS